MRDLLRATILLLALCAGLAPAKAQGTAQEAIAAAVAAGDKRHALLVGVGNYERTVPVRFVEENLDAVESMLRDVFFVPEANIRRVTDPSVIDLSATFGFDPGEPGDFGGLSIAEPDAELFVYFIGHGSRDLRAAGTSDAAASEGFLLARNSRPANLSRTAYSYDTLIANLDAFRARHFPEGRVVLFLESCFSGETNDGPINPTLGPMIAPIVGWEPPAESHDVVAIAAAGADTPAYWDDERRLGLFTDALVRGLRGGADDGDGTLTLEELGRYLSDSVPARALSLGKSEQRPQLNENAAGTLVSLPLARRAVLSQSVDVFTIDFEIEEFEYRLEEAGEKDFAALRALDADLADFLDRCGDTCRPFLSRLIPLRDAASGRLARCEAASTAAGRRIGEGRFDRLAAFDALCAAEEDVAACVRSRDGASRGCRCVVAPGGEGCGADPVAACAAAFDEAAAAARAAGSLAPLTDFEKGASPDCRAREGSRLTGVRAAVCEAGEAAHRGGPVPEGLSGCGWALTLAERRAREAECASAWDAARAGPEAGLADFIATGGDCAEREDALAERERRLSDALAEAGRAGTGPEREAAAARLGALREAFAATLSPAALRRVDDAIASTARASCPAAFREAERDGTDGLARFAAERNDCPGEVLLARRAMEAARCERGYSRIDEDDPLALFRFVRTNDRCTTEVARAERRIDRLAVDCLYDAQSGLAADIASIDRAIERVEACDQRFASMSPRFAERSGERLETLKEMRRTQAALETPPRTDPATRQPAPPPLFLTPDQPDQPGQPSGRGGTLAAIYDGIDFYGADVLGPVDASSETDCARRCAGHSRCRAFTFNTRARKCFLKWGTGEIRTHQDARSGMLFDRTSGPPSLSAGRGAILYNRDFPGNDIMAATLNNTTLAACQAACNANPSCAAFSYIERMRQCWIKHTAGRSRPRAGVHSGVSSVRPSQVLTVN